MYLAPVLKQRYLDANGSPLAGGKLYSYQAGTTTPQATYTDSAGGTANANPVVLDANGEAAVWLNPELSYKFVLADSDDVTQFTVDNVVGLVTEDAVVTGSIQDEAVTTEKLADDAVTAAKLKSSASIDADRPVTADHIRDLAVTVQKLANDAVETAKIKDLNVTTAKLANESVTADKLAALNSVVSSSCGSFTQATEAEADVTNLSVSITTTGRPVIAMLICNTSDVGRIELTPGLTTSAAVVLRLYRGSDEVGKQGFGAPPANPAGATSIPLSAFQWYDSPAAGTYTYKVRAFGTGSTLPQIIQARLLVFEL